MSTRSPDRTPMTADEVLRELRALGDPRWRDGMAHFGISTDVALGVSVPKLRALAKRAGRDHAVAHALWASGVHEARALAAMVAEPAKLTRREMDRWAGDLASWDTCDACCFELWRRTPYAHEKAAAWSASKKEFVKRAGFALMAALAVHDKSASDATFRRYLPIIRREAGDERNFVKKAVNWALRQIGKRSRRLNAAAIACAERIRADGTRAGRWTASDALRELRGEAVQRRLAGPDSPRRRKGATA